MARFVRIIRIYWKQREDCMYVSFGLGMVFVASERTAVSHSANSSKKIGELFRRECRNQLFINVFCGMMQEHRMTFHHRMLRT